MYMCNITALKEFLIDRDCQGDKPRFMTESTAVSPESGNLEERWYLPVNDVEGEYYLEMLEQLKKHQFIPQDSTLNDYDYLFYNNQRYRELAGNKNAEKERINNILCKAEDLAKRMELHGILIKYPNVEKWKLTQGFIDFVEIDCHIMSKYPAADLFKEIESGHEYITFVLIPRYLGGQRIDAMKRAKMPHWKADVDAIIHDIGPVYKEAGRIVTDYMNYDEGYDELVNMAKIVSMILYPMGFTFKNGVPSFSIHKQNSK